MVNLEASLKARAAFEAVDRARWVEIRVEPTEQGLRRQYKYLDEGLDVIRERSEPTDYDATQRPWYEAALKNDAIHRTGPYIFAVPAAPGQTTSIRVGDSDTVMAIDLTLESLSQYLAQMDLAQQGTLFLYSAQGQIIASSLPQEAVSEADVEPLLSLASTPGGLEQLVGLDYGGVAHYAFSAPLATVGGEQTFIGILEPVHTVVGPFLERVKLSIAITGVFLLLLVPLSWFFAGPIVNPVRQLALENEKVRRRDFGKVRRIPSHVLELDELSESMVTMVSAIQEHEAAQERLMESIIKLIAEAIDDKSPYTGGHCERVPELALLLARHASDSDEPPFDQFRLETEDQWREYRMAAWLHDCGKITTPEHVVDKGSKLETIYNRIHEVRMRFEVLWRDAELDYWQQLAEHPREAKQLESRREERQRQLQTDFEFIAACNIGSESLDEAKQQRLAGLAGITWQRHFDDRLGLSPVEELRMPGEAHQLPVTEHLLNDRPEHIVERTRSVDYPHEFGIQMDIPEHQYNLGELYNLSVSRGTLTREDRFRINEHMISTIKMLEGLPFPEELSNVPRFASTHHETMDGTGYPRRLSAEDLSIPERLLAIADVFEALTAADRPYKKEKSVSEAVHIMFRMVENNHLDRDCFELFLKSDTHLHYSRQFLTIEQVDSVEKSQYLRTAG